MAKILVIDDCDQFRESLNDLLSQQGYDVVLAESSETAKSFLDESTFDLVVCDLALPLAGFEIEGQPRGDARGDECAMVGVHMIYALSNKYPQMPIIAVSGQLTGKPLEAISKFGAVRCFSKPFATDVFLNAVEEELTRAEE